MNTVRTVFAVWMVLVVIILTGWIKNVVKLSNCDFQAPYKAEIIHTIGLMPFVGMFTGWMDLGK